MKPSDAYKAGLCPMCSGTGQTWKVVPVIVKSACSGCGGLKTLDAFLTNGDVENAVYNGVPIPDA